ncbi:MAG: YkvA family protein [Acidobacteriota bacterium]
MEENIEKYKGHYSESSFWEKVKTAAVAAGRELIEKALWLYYALMDKDTPRKARLIILGALGYFILPIDLVPDFIPFVGYTDDLTVLAGAIMTVASNIKEEHKEKAAGRLKEWFG